MQRPEQDEQHAAFENVSGELGAGGEIRLERFIPALITQAAHKLAANNSAVYREMFDITLMEWRVMLHLFAQPGSSAAQLAHTIGYDKASISRTADSLMKRGLMRDQANVADARSSHLYLTDAGIGLYENMLPTALDQERTLLAALSAKEAEVLVDLLARVVDQLRASGRQPTQRRAPTKGATRRRSPA